MIYRKKQSGVRADMFDLMQKAYVKILNPIYEGFMKDVSPVTCRRVIWTCLALHQAYFVLLYSLALKKTVFRDLLLWNIGSSVLLFIVCVFSMRGPLRPVRWNRPLMFLFLACGFGLVVTGSLHPIGAGYQSFGVMLLTVYPCLYFVWNCRGGYGELFDIAAHSAITVGLGYVVFSVFYILSGAPYLDGTTNRIRSTMYNSNLFSMIGMVIVCSAVYLLYRRDMKKTHAAILAASVPVGILVVLAGQSRASALVCAGAAAVTVIHAVKVRRAGTDQAPDSLQKRPFSMKTAAVVIACLFVIGSIFMQLQSRSLLDRFSFWGKDLNTFMSGRIVVWKFYAGHLNLLGNDYTKIDWTVLGLHISAHNNFLEFGIRSGVIVAGLFILFELITGVKSLVYLFSKRYKERCYLFLIIFMVMYAIESMIDVASISLIRHAPFFFYLMLAPFFEKPQKEEQEVR